MSRGGVPTVVGRAAAGLLAPLVIFYGLRALDVGLYVALMVSALVSGLPTLVGLVRRRPVNALSAYFTTMVLGSLLVALVAGSTEFLLAKEAVLTGVTGVWFLVSAAGDRPLAYVFSKPLLSGRARWPADWDGLWASAPRWRRMWRVSSVLFGIGSIADALARVLFAYTLPADVVPALATGLYAVTGVLLIIVVNVYYVLSGVYDPRSALYAAPHPMPSTGR